MGKKPAARQPSPMWVTTADLPTSAGHPFFERLNRVLEEAGFDAFVEGLCAVFYASRLGRPSLRPGRYFRLLFIGYFEGLSSERGIAWRVADSLSLRAFLDLDVTEAPPNHSTLSRTRRLIRRPRAHGGGGSDEPPVEKGSALTFENRAGRSHFSWDTSTPGATATSADRRPRAERGSRGGGRRVRPCQPGTTCSTRGPARPSARASRTTCSTRGFTNGGKRRGPVSHGLAVEPARTGWRRCAGSREDPGVDDPRCRANQHDRVLSGVKPRRYAPRG